MLEKGRVATMTTVRFTQQARRALVPMRKATLDAFLLTILTVVCLAFLGIPVTHPFLIVLVFALVYVIAVVLRLRRAATNSPAAQSEWQVPVSCLNSRLIRILGDQRCDSMKSMYISSSETRVDHICSRGSPQYEPGSVS